jgi:hypothetical protein
MSEGRIIEGEEMPRGTGAWLDSAHAVVGAVRPVRGRAACHTGSGRPAGRLVGGAGLELGL